MSKTAISTELKSHFLRLYQMALTDDQFDVLELKTLYSFADDRGVPREELDRLLLNPVDHSSTIPKDLNTRIEYLYDLATMILADNVITEDEKSTLRKYCRKFEFLEENVEQLSAYLLECVKNGVKKETLINELNN
ncbi:hypothetical protein E0K83_12525 [Gramella sp. BOM4]|uniref:Co-chaperone DjlA N-terminal domain-containing protein n=1 Tax=Christiangramia oceanisediminis TaxID=2920386 RepID=A0A9X2REG9_9FLAO|nr:hypothetical protein [Gramella oceanisediminis]MCP9201341.1 hypothetical protein [Gramella oceanisediminis]MUP46563.1 hypothetical protein [Christiangramia bathymodioli]